MKSKEQDFVETIKKMLNVDIDISFTPFKHIVFPKDLEQSQRRKITKLYNNIFK